MAKRKIITETPDEAVEPIASSTDELTTILDNAPVLPSLIGPNIDAHQLMTNTFIPAYREFLLKLRRYADNV